jgi:N-acyl homoserine lactone hydrolase
MMKALWILCLLGLIVGCAGPDRQLPGNEGDLKLYVFDCGSLRSTDISSFSIGNDETDVRELFVPCYLIDHPRGQLFWDAGLDPSIVGKGELALNETAFQQYDRSVIDQLSDLGVSPGDVEFLAISHMHFDHSGAANYFVASNLLIQQSEFNAAFLHAEDNPLFTYDLYKDLIDSQHTLLNGDHDVFGDGRVQVISAPGHTPGHQLLYLELENTGPLVLSGDLYHFRESRSLRRTPVFNTDAAQTLRSMDKVEALIAERGATLWIEHDKVLADSLNLAPAYYD